MYQTLATFSAGELTPRLSARPDLAQYARGCREMVNFLPTPYGGAERRPGTVLVEQYAANGFQPSRVLPFQASSGAAYLLEFGDHEILVRRMAPEASGPGPGWAPPVCRLYAVEGAGKRQIYGSTGWQTAEAQASFPPWTAAQARGIAFVQSNDVMFLAHPECPLQILRRTGGDEFEIGEYAFKYPPVLDMNADDAKTVKALAKAAAGASVTLRGTQGVFTDAMVGEYFQLTVARKSGAGVLEEEWDASDTSAALPVKGTWTLVSHGTWSGTLTLQRRYGGTGDWTDVVTCTSEKDNNISTAGTEEEEDAEYRVVLSNYVHSETGSLKRCKWLFSNPDFTSTGVVRIESVDDVSGSTDRTATGTALRPFRVALKPSPDWCLGAFSASRGYPRAISFYQERLFLAGGAAFPNRIWGSRTDAWDDFLVSEEDDAGLDFTLASDTTNTVRWLCQHDALVVGTDDSEWTVSPGERGGALTPTSLDVRRQSVYGSAAVPARMVGEVVLFAQRPGRRLREFVYSYEKDGYTAPDLTLLAEHLFRDASVAEVAVQRFPECVVWCLLSDGTLAAMSYDRSQEVTAWSRHETAGTVLSVCVVPCAGEERLFLLVGRGMGGACLECLDFRKEPVYMDSARFVSHGAGPCTVTPAPVAPAATGGFALVAGGAAMPAPSSVSTDSTPRVVLEVPEGVPAGTLAYGCAYESVLTPMPLEIAAQDGTTLRRAKGLSELRVAVYNSLGGEVRAGASPWRPMVLRDTRTDPMDEGPASRDAVAQVQARAGFARSMEVSVRQTQPLPLNVASVTALWSMEE